MKQAVFAILAGAVIGYLMLAGEAQAPVPVPTPPISTAATDVEVASSSCSSSAWGTVAKWDVTLRNKGDVGFKDLTYKTTYRGESGRVLHTHEGVFTIILGPRQTRTIEGFNDGFVPQQVASCELVITGVVE